MVALIATNCHNTAQHQIANLHFCHLSALIEAQFYSTVVDGCMHYKTNNIIVFHYVNKTIIILGIIIFVIFT